MLKEKLIMCDCNDVKEVEGFCLIKEQCSAMIYKSLEQDKKYRIIKKVISNTELTNECIGKYTLFDMKDGYTLYDYVLSRPKKCLMLNEAIERIIILLRMLEKLHQKKLCHANITPNMIWLDSENRMSIWEQGSVFSYGFVDDIPYMAEKEISDLCRDLVECIDLDYCDEKYWSSIIAKIWYTQKVFSCDTASVKKKDNFLDAVVNVGIQSDIYSVVKIFYFMITGTHYKDDCFDSDVFLKECIYGKNVAKKIIHLLQNNERSLYISVDEVENDLLTLTLNDM